MRQPLSGSGWTLRAAKGSTIVPAAIRARDIPALVPGCVHTDLLNASLIGHPNDGFNERELGWIGRTDWTYRRSFVTRSELREHERIELVCEGLDTVATIALNGREIGSAANMHHPHRFDVRDALRAGENELVIAFRSPVRYVEEEEARRGRQPYNGDWGQYIFIRKMACNFGWDWGPMVPTAGIWRDVYLHAWSAARFQAVRPHVLRADDDVAEIAVCADLARGADPDDDLQIRVELACRDGRTFQVTIPVSPEADSGEARIAVDRPERWWPRGYGDQPLHRLTVELMREGRVLDRWSGRIGLRTVRLNTDPDEIGSRFTIEVNGQPVFAKGANWIPDGLFPSELTPERYRGRVRQAYDANMNMLRVWGGGIYEDPAFYEACDELGVMVWQDFMFACATYPEEEPYPALVEAEARHNIARLSTHPSVMLWCGGNECIWAYESWGFKEKLRAGQTWGRGFYLELLPRLMGELDPTRPYWPNSPYSGAGRTELVDPNHGNRHTWDARIEGYRALVPRFVSEFGHQGPPNYATLRRALPETELALDSEALRHRQRAGGGNEKQYQEPISDWFRSPASFDEWHYLAQVLQARAISLGIEWLRAHTPRCMGVLYWQLNDCWAGHSWSAIDWEGRPKPLWYATRQAYDPRLLTIQPIDGRPTLCAVNDANDTWTETARLRRMRFDGAVLAEAGVPIAVEPGTSVHVADLDDALGETTDRSAELLVADAGERRALWFFEHDKHLAYPEPRYAARLSRKGATWRLLVHAETLVRDVVLAVDRLDPGARASAQLVTLLPGESRAFEIASMRELTVEALTVPPVFDCANRYTVGS